MPIFKGGLPTKHLNLFCKKQHYLTIGKCHNQNLLVLDSGLPKSFIESKISSMIMLALACFALAGKGVVLVWKKEETTSLASVYGNQK